MGARARLPVLPAPRQLLGALAGLTALALLSFLGARKLGTAGVLLPVVIFAGAAVLSRPLAAVGLLLVLTILCEGPTFGVLSSLTSRLYEPIYHDLSVLDAFAVLAALGVGVDLLRSRRPLWIPRSLALALALLALAMAAGVVVGHGAGASLRFALFSEHVLAYLLVLPLAVANLDVDRARIERLLRLVMGLAIFKALLGLVEVAGHLGPAIEGTATLSYYEPAANWLITIALLMVVAQLVGRSRPPLWMLLGGVLLLACLVLSYRRSFWIGASLGVVLVVMLGVSASGRRLLVPAVLALAAAILLLSSVKLQSQLPLVKRLTSLSPSRLEANLEDRYRLDERANVWGNIEANPITGLGVTIPWKATVQPLAIEHEEGGRQYVHFAALWFWLKLGILGVIAYAAVMLAAAATAWQAWRASSEPLLRAFSLASLCGLAGMVAMDTTASFTGVDARTTVLVGAQLGLLALLARLPAQEASSAASASIE